MQVVRPLNVLVLLLAGLAVWACAPLADPRLYSVGGNRWLLQAAAAFAILGSIFVSRRSVGTQSSLVEVPTALLLACLAGTGLDLKYWNGSTPIDELKVVRESWGLALGFGSLSLAFVVTEVCTRARTMVIANGRAPSRIGLLAIGAILLATFAAVVIVWAARTNAEGREYNMLQTLISCYWLTATWSISTIISWGKQVI